MNKIKLMMVVLLAAVFSAYGVASNLVFYSDFENAEEGQLITSPSDLNGATVAPPSLYPQTGLWTGFFLYPNPTAFGEAGGSMAALIRMDIKQTTTLTGNLSSPALFKESESVRFSYDFIPGFKGNQIITGCDAQNDPVFVIKMAGPINAMSVTVNGIEIGLANSGVTTPMNSISLLLDSTGIDVEFNDGTTVTTNKDIPVLGGTNLVRFIIGGEAATTKFFYDNFLIYEIGPRYTLTVNSGAGDGLYANGRQVAISADVVSGQSFDRWIGDTQYVDSVTSSSATVTMSTNPVTLTATYVTDNKKPILSITSPTAELKVLATNGLFTVRGTASDNKTVTKVLVKLNGGSWINASTTNDWKNWCLPVELIPGRNTIRAYSVDSAMNRSPIEFAECTYVPGAVITVQINGSGAVIPDYNGQMLEIGKRYTMGAKAVKHSPFINWTYGIGGPVAASKREITFVMESNLVLTANFNNLPGRSALAASAALATPTTAQAAITVDGSSKDWTGVPRSSFSYASVTQEVAVALDGNNVALLLTGCPFGVSDNILVYFKLRLSYGDADNRHSVDLWTSGSVLYGMVDGKVITGLEAVLLNGVLEVKLPVSQVPSQVTIEEIGCGMDLGAGTLTELFKLTPPTASTQ